MRSFIRRLMPVVVAATLLLPVPAPTLAQTPAPSKDEVMSWTQGAFTVSQPQKAVGKHLDEYFIWATLPTPGSTEIPTASVVIPDQFVNADWHTMSPDNVPAYGRGPTGLTGFKWAFIRLGISGSAESQVLGLTVDDVKAWGVNAGRPEGAPYIFAWTPKKDVTVPDMLNTKVRYYWFTGSSMNYGEGPGVMTNMAWGFVLAD